MAKPEQEPGERGQPSLANTGKADVQQLAESLTAVAREMESFDDPHLLLAEIVEAAVEMVPGAEQGSVSVVVGRNRVSSLMPTGPLPERVDALQEQTGEGPCLDSAFLNETVRVADLRTDDRWPRFAPLAAEAGAMSMLSLQLYVDGDDLGALNLFASTPGAFTDESEYVGLLFAAQAAIAYVGARKEDHFARLLSSRDLIGQAKGILMERHRVGSSRAFMLLTQASAKTNRRLHDLAVEVVQTGWARGLPPRPTPPPA